MVEVTCRGIPASWINSWLAAIGATVLDARIRLHWTEGSNLAVFSSEEIDPVDALTESWPNERFVSELPISSQWKGFGVIKRRITVADFQKRARAARDHSQSWTLSSTVTDLSVEKNGEVVHAPFDPPGPGTVKWLHHRLQRIHQQVSAPSPNRIRSSLTGEAQRIQNNGLGFDLSRIGSGGDECDKWIDPIVEVMAFFGLAMFPMRGLGVDARLPFTRFDKGRQRGWIRNRGTDDIHRFYWPAWCQPLGMDGIDALLDAWEPFKPQKWDLIGVRAGWKSVAYKNNSANDPTRAYGSERI